MSVIKIIVIKKAALKIKSEKMMKMQEQRRSKNFRKSIKLLVVVSHSAGVNEQTSFSRSMFGVSFEIELGQKVNRLFRSNLKKGKSSGTLFDSY